MFRLVELPNDGRFSQKATRGAADRELTPSDWKFLGIAYAKSGSLAGDSLCSTEPSSVSYAGPSDSIETEDESLLGENLLDEIDNVFFDCLSEVFDDDSSISDEIALYINGKCVYSDGSPAYVPVGNCRSQISRDYMEFCNGNLRKARTMWEATQAWRKEEHIWNIHTKPNIRFQEAKAYYPSCYHGYSKASFVIEYSYPGQMDSKNLIPNAEAMDDIMRHHFFMQEYITNCLYTCKNTWNKLGKLPPRLGPETSTSCGVVVVLDLKGTGPHLLTSAVFTFLRRMIESSATHYPTLAKQCLIINAPFWASGVFATLKPFLPDSLPVEIVSEQGTMEALQRYIDDEQLPKEYGGTNPYALHQHPFELELHRFVTEVAKKHRSSESIIKKGSLNELELEIEQRAEMYCSIDTSLDIIDDTGSLTLTPQPLSRSFAEISFNFLGSLMHGFFSFRGSLCVPGSKEHH